MKKKKNTGVFVVGKDIFGNKVRSMMIPRKMTKYFIVTHPAFFSPTVVTEKQLSKIEKLEKRKMRVKRK